jgi:hypothetical protein
MSNTQKLENFHILLWITKDLSWLMFWKALGMIMIVPTLSFAILIAYKNRNKSAELMHSLAVIFWVIANSTWMMIEFFDLDNLRIIPLLSFLIGLALVLFYYTSQFFNRKNLLNQ